MKQVNNRGIRPQEKRPYWVQERGHKTPRQHPLQIALDLAQASDTIDELKQIWHSWPVWHDSVTFRQAVNKKKRELELSAGIDVER